MMEFYERVSGARMHAAYVRPGGVSLVRLSTELIQILGVQCAIFCWVLRG